jgi:hypothetical protein
VLDIVPTHTVFSNVSKALATDYYHWFFLIQPDDFPERLIGADPDYYLEHKPDVRGRALSCGHFPAEESPEETAEELVAFLT